MGITFAELSFRHPWHWFALDRLFFWSPRLIVGDVVYTNNDILRKLSLLFSGSKVLLLIHGYSVKEKDARKLYLEMVEEIAKEGLPYTVVIGISWPARTKPGYWLAEGAARTLGRKLCEILSAIAGRGFTGHHEPPVYVDAQAHSAGNIALLESNKHGHLSRVLRNMILTNAAIHDRALGESNSYYWSARNILGKCLVIFSKNDTVLGGVYNKFGSLPGNGWGRDVALGFSGPCEPPEVPLNVIAVDATEWCLGHSEARKAKQFYQHIKNIA